MSGTAVRPAGAVTARRAPARRLPAVLAVALVVLGVLAVAVRLDAPADQQITVFEETQTPEERTGGAGFATDATRD